MNAIQFPGISQGIGKRGDTRYESALQSAICSYLLGVWACRISCYQLKHYTSGRLDSYVWLVNMSSEGCDTSTTYFDYHSSDITLSTLWE